MAFIVNVGGDNRLQIAGEEFVRKTGFGTNWSKLRVGVLMMFNDSGSDILTANLQIGLCEGSTNTYSSGNTTGYLGMAFGETSGGPVTFTRSASLWYAPASGSRGLTKVERIGSTTSRTYVNTGLVSQAISYSFLCYYFFDVTKQSATTYAWNFFWQADGLPAPTPVSQSDYWYWLEQENPAMINQAISSATYGGNLAQLDTVSLYWNKTVPSLEISEINVIRFA